MIKSPVLQGVNVTGDRALAETMKTPHLHAAGVNGGPLADSGNVTGKV